MRRDSLPQGEACRRGQPFELQAEFAAGKEHLPFVFIGIGRAGGVHQRPARAEQARRLPQKLFLQADEGRGLAVFP